MWVCPRCEQNNRDEDGSCTLCGASRTAPVSKPTATGGAWGNVGDWRKDASARKPAPAPAPRPTAPPPAQKPASAPLPRQTAAPTPQSTPVATSVPPACDAPAENTDEIAKRKSKLKGTRVGVFITSIILITFAFAMPYIVYLYEPYNTIFNLCCFVPSFLFGDKKRPALRKAGKWVSVLFNGVGCIIAANTLLDAAPTLVSVALFLLFVTRWYYHYEMVEHLDWLAANGEDPTIR